MKLGELSEILGQIDFSRKLIFQNLPGRFFNFVSFNLRFPGQDHQEDRAAYGVHRLQEEDAGSPEEDQALRAGRRQEEEGTDDPVLD